MSTPVVVGAVCRPNISGPGRRRRTAVAVVLGVVALGLGVVALGLGVALLAALTP